MDISAPVGLLGLLMQIIFVSGVTKRHSSSRFPRKVTLRANGNRFYFE